MAFRVSWSQHIWLFPDGCGMLPCPLFSQKLPPLFVLGVGTDQGGIWAPQSSLPLWTRCWGCCGKLRSSRVASLVLGPGWQLISPKYQEKLPLKWWRARKFKAKKMISMQRLVEKPTYCLASCNADSRESREVKWVSPSLQRDLWWANVV